MAAGAQRTNGELTGVRTRVDRATASVVAVTLVYAAIGVLAVARALDADAPTSLTADAQDAGTAPDDDSVGRDDAASPRAGATSNAEITVAGAASREAGATGRSTAPSGGTEAVETGAGASSRSAGTATGAPTAPGITDTEIVLGFEVSKNLQAGFALVGASGSPPEERDIVTALVSWVNEHGGIAGRRIVPVLHEVDRTQGSFDAQEEAACADFTEDHRVFAAGSTPVSGNDPLVACIAKKGVPLIEGNLFPYDDQYYAQYRGILFQPSRVSATAAMRSYTAGLAEAGWYTGATIGMLRLDAPVFGRLSDDVVKPGMARFGAAVTEEVVVSTPQDLAGLGGINAQLSNAIVRFRGRGVDHLSILEIQGAISFFFMKEAESQGWRPSYGMHSYNIPATQAQNQNVNQLRTSVGVGWLPSVDVFGPEQPASAAVDQCMSIMRDAGIPLDYLTYSFYTHTWCDSVFFLKSALEAAPDLSLTGFVAGVERLGDSWQAASSVATEFGPGRHGGAAATRTFAFDEGCTCYRYTGEPRTI